MLFLMFVKEARMKGEDGAAAGGVRRYWYYYYRELLW